MNIHILMFDDRVERASFDARKMQQLADEYNGIDPLTHEVLIGPYFVVSVEAEDFPDTKKDIQ